MIAVLLAVILFFHTNVWFEDMAKRAEHYFNPHPTAAPSVTPSVKPSAWSGSVEQWRPLVATHFAAAKVDTAMCLMGYESKGNPDAKNSKSSAAGLFQFLKGTWDSVPLSVTGGSYDSGRVYNPEANIRSAAWLQNAAGWSQWSPYNRGLCRGS
jgi:Transglycosylase SLT domain